MHCQALRAFAGPVAARLGYLKPSALPDSEILRSRCGCVRRFGWSAPLLLAPTLDLMSNWDALVGAVVGGAFASGGGAFVAWRDRLRARRVEMFDVHLPSLREHWSEITSERLDRTAPLSAARRCAQIASTGDRRRFADISIAVRRGRIANRHARFVREEIGTEEDDEAMRESMDEIEAARHAFEVARHRYATWLASRLTLSGAVGHRLWRFRYKRIVGEAPEENELERALNE